VHLASFGALSRDARFALLALRRDPLFVAVASGSLALALGVVTSVYGVIDAALHPPSAIRDPQRVVYIWNGGSGASAGYSRAMFADLALQRQRVFGDVALLDARLTSYSIGSYVDHGMVQVVSREFFRTTGIRPHIGRAFGRADYAAASAPVAMIGFVAWRQALGAQPSALGRTVDVDGRQYTIVGVMPPDVSSHIGADFILPASPSERLTAPTLIGRLRPGVSLPDVQEQFRSGIDAELTSRFGVGRFPFRSNVRSARELPPLMTDLQKMLLAASGLIVLIASANIANLMLARGVRRSREYALRFALGARRSSIARQTLFEALVCAVLAGVIGVILAAWLFDLITYGLTRDVPTLGVIEVSLNWRVFAIAIGTALGAALVFGLYPALRVSSARVNHLLKDGGATVTRRPRVRYSPFVIAQIALTLTLLMGGNLLVQSAEEWRDRDIGFEPRGLLTVMAFVPPILRDSIDMRSWRTSLVDAIAREPDVRSLATVRSVIPAGHGVVVTAPSGGSRRSYLPSYSHVSATYLGTLGIRIHEGRDLVPGDEVSEVGAAVVSRTAARTFWRGESAIGQMLTLGDGGSSAPLVRVVGIAEDVTPTGLGPGVEPSPAVYVARRDSSSRQEAILVRTSAKNERAMQTRLTLRGRDVSPPHGVVSVRPYLAAESSQVAILYFIAGTFIALGRFALSLALFGVFSVRAHDVAHRMREFAVRMSLGASHSDIARLVFRDTMVIVLAGTGIGAVLAMYAGYRLDQWLYGVFYTDVRALLVAEFLLITTTLLASLAPAFRAARSNPVEILRAS
jgi:putative ABC transport system permease protein